jgi:hypothetical protein
LKKRALHSFQSASILLGADGGCDAVHHWARDEPRGLIQWLDRGGGDGGASARLIKRDGAAVMRALRGWIIGGASGSAAGSAQCARQGGELLALASSLQCALAVATTVVSMAAGEGLAPNSSINANSKMAAGRNEILSLNISP